MGERCRSSGDTDRVVALWEDLDGMEDGARARRGSGQALVPARGPFGQALRAFREGRGVSQAELGRRLGMSHATVSRLESGSRRPSRVMALRIAHALGLSDDERAQLLVAAGYWPTVSNGNGQAVLAEIGLYLADRRLPDAVRDEAYRRLAEIAAWLRDVRDGGRRG